MTRSRLACTTLAMVLSAAMPFGWADDFVVPANADLKATTPDAAFAPLIQVSAELQPGAANVPPSPPADIWTAPPLIEQSSYLGNGNRFWAGADLLVWGIKPGNTPPLATSGTLASLGAIGPGTTTLFGGNQDYGTRLGGGFTMGTWLNPSQTQGVEGSFFFLNGSSNNFFASADGAPGSNILARPFVNAITGLQDSQQLSFPNLSSGSLGISSGSQLFGAQLNGICNLCCSNSCSSNCCSTGCCQTGYGQSGNFNQSGYRVDMIGGFRYLNLNENLVITENITFLPTAPAPPFDPGSTIMVTDRFQTSNNFYGGQIGARGEWYRGAWFTNVSGKVALGDTHQVVRINGSTVFTSSTGTSVTQNGGLLALPTNIGSYSRDQFSVVPEVGVNVGRQLTNNVRLYVGYTLIYWSSVVRPGDQIDPVINPTQLPTSTGPGTLVGPARPAFAFHDTDFWAQGINFGVEVRR